MCYCSLGFSNSLLWHYYHDQVNDHVFHIVAVVTICVEISYKLPYTRSSYTNTYRQDLQIESLNEHHAYMIFFYPSLVLKFPIVLNQYSVYTVSPPNKCKTKCILIISGFRYCITDFWISSEEVSIRLKVES